MVAHSNYLVNLHKVVMLNSFEFSLFSIDCVYSLFAFPWGHPDRNDYVSGSVIPKSLTPGVLCGTLDRKPTSGIGQSLFVVCF